MSSFLCVPGGEAGSILSPPEGAGLPEVVVDAVAGAELAEGQLEPVAHLQLRGVDVAELDLVELNEAFASQSIVVIRELGLDEERVNVNGGAIALGHPLGMTGARLVVSLLHELRRREGRYGLATLCVGDRGRTSSSQVAPSA